MNVTIDFNKINNWDSFHSVFQDIMGFPNFYGRNMNAWIDCMSYIDDPEAGMSLVTVKHGESLDIVVLGAEEAFIRCAEILQSFIECVAFVNQRFIESDTNTRLRIVVI